MVLTTMNVEINKMSNFEAEQKLADLKKEAIKEMKKLQDTIDCLEHPHIINWGHVGDAGRIVDLLKEINGTEA